MTTLLPSPSRARGAITRRDALVAAGGLLIATSTCPRAAPGTPADLKFSELYKSFGIRGLEFSDKLVALAGQRVTLKGFMAPPLKPETNFFVLTREPVALCPFCSSDAEWPVDIVVVYLAGSATPTAFSSAIAVTGTLEVGSKTDAATGFVSQIRLIDASFRTL